jgi:uncharacterized protein YeaO (DUF488 family)
MAANVKIKWARDLAPSAELRRWFGLEPSRFAEFRDRYRLGSQLVDGAV